MALGQVKDIYGGQSARLRIAQILQARICTLLTSLVSSSSNPMVPAVEELQLS